jgi:hypothetical protein
LPIAGTRNIPPVDVLLQVTDEQGQCGRRHNGNRRLCLNIFAGEEHERRFLQIASGSASELDYHLLLSHDLGFMKDERYAFETNAYVPTAEG